MQKLSNFSQKIIEYCFYTLLFITPFIFSSWNSELFELPKMYFTFALTTIVTGTWLVKSIVAGKLIFRRTILDVPLLIFLTTQAVSTYFSIDQHTSIWGYYSRMNGGLLSLVSYSLLYWAFASNMDREKTLLCIRYLLVSAGLISIYAILERLGVSPSCYLLKGELNTDCWVQRVQERAFATLGQPNWLAAWLAAILPLSLIPFISKLNRINYTPIHISVYFSLSILIFLAILFTNSRSGLLGLGVAFTVFTFSLFLLGENRGLYSTDEASRNKLFSIWRIPRILILGSLFLNRKSYILNPTRPLLLLTTSYILLAAILGTPFTPPLTSLLTPSTSPTTHNSQPIPIQGGTDSGEIRQIIWQGAVNIWKATPIFGTGPETFAHSYYWFRPIEHNLTSEWELLYNKAHNEYLNYLGNTGTVGFIGYILPILAFIFWFTKRMINGQWPMLNKENNLSFTTQSQALLIIYHLALFSGFASILVTNFFGFSVVTVATLFYLFPAFAIVSSLTQPLTTKPFTHNALPNPLRILLSTFVLCCMFYLLWRLATYFQADLFYAKAEKLSRQDLDTEAVLTARDAINLRDNEPLYFDKLANSASYVAVSFQETNNPEKAQEMATLAHDSTLYATHLSAYNITFLKSQSLTLMRLSLIDQSYLEKALYPLERASNLAPTDPKVHYNLGVLYHRLGQEEKARNVLEKAVGLKPDYYDAHTGLGEIYEKLGETQKAREQYEYVLQYLNPEDEKVMEALENLQK